MLMCREKGASTEGEAENTEIKVPDEAEEWYLRTWVKGLTWEEVLREERK